MRQWFQNLFKKKSSALPLSKQAMYEQKFKKAFSNPLYFQDKDYLVIGEYQLINLLSNPVKFVLLDFRDKNESPQLMRSQLCRIENLQEFSAKNILSKDEAIVAVCEKGDISHQAAKKLFQWGYKNVVVLKDGTASLSAAIHDVKDMYTILHKKL